MGNFTSAFLIWHNLPEKTTEYRPAFDMSIQVFDQNCDCHFAWFNASFTLTMKFTTLAKSSELHARRPVCSTTNKVLIGFLHLLCRFILLRFQLWFSPKAPNTVNSCHFSIRWLLLKHNGGRELLHFFSINAARIPVQQIRAWNEE